MPDAETSPRQRNRRGQGALLRDAIVDAASALLEQTGAEEALTLRAIARAAGVTAPSIYAHFASPYEIKLALVQRTFATLAQVLRPAAAQGAEPVPALYAVCRAYLDFAAGHPSLYRVLFERSRRETVEPGSAGNDVTTIVGADAFGALLAAVRACTDPGDSAEAATVRLWVSLHGMATLRASIPWFPWPPRDALLDQLIQRAVDLHPPRGHPAGPVP